MEPRGDFFDFDPLTGLAEYMETHADGRISIHTYQDVEPYLNHAKALANSGLPDDNWRQNEVSVYAVLPPIVQMQLLQKGIDVLDPNAMPQLLREVNTTYSQFKTTYKHHAVRG